MHGPFFVWGGGVFRTQTPLTTAMKKPDCYFQQYYTRFAVGLFCSFDHSLSSYYKQEA